MAEGTLALVHEEKVRAGALAADAAQRDLIHHFERLEEELRRTRAPVPLLKRFRERRRMPRGLYVWGEVGRGKTLLMDEFFAASAAAPKRRVHFNEFMNDVQDRLHVARGEAERSGVDPVDAVAGAIAAETRLLCLDEFMVTDIADAMILSRLFQALFAAKLVLVATSNSAPENLYRDGLNRGLFLPFIDILRSHVEVVHLDAPTDYRLARLAGAPVYVTPPDRAALDAFWRRLTDTDRGAPAALHTRGRAIPIPEAADGVARFAFADLCEAPLAAHDFVQIARAYHTVIVDGIPVIARDRRDVAQRFVLLVDTLYDHHVNLIASAAAEPEGIYPQATGDVAFAFRRTVSRLSEMRSEAYLAAEHGAKTGAPGA
jgi:cell division protein ZapE